MTPEQVMARANMLAVVFLMVAAVGMAFGRWRDVQFPDQQDEDFEHAMKRKERDAVLRRKSEGELLKRLRAIKRRGDQITRARG